MGFQILHSLLVCWWPACNRADIHTKPCDAKTSALSLVAAEGVLDWPAGFPKVLSLILIIAPYVFSPAGSSDTNSGFRQVAWNTFPQLLWSWHQWFLVVQETGHWVLLVPKTVRLCSVPPDCLVILVHRGSACAFSIFSSSTLVQIPSLLGILWFTFHIFTEIPNYFLPTYFLLPCLTLITSLGNLLSRLSPLIRQKQHILDDAPAVASCLPDLLGLLGLLVSGNFSCPILPIVKFLLL